MTAANIPETVAKLQEHLASLGVLPEFPTDREHALYRRRYDAIQREISELRDLPNQLARAQSRLDDVESRSAAVLAKQRELEQALAAAPNVTDPRERAKEQNRQGVLQRQLQLLHDGALYKAPGVVFEPLDYLDVRIKELTQRRDALQSALDGHLKAAEQLLAVPS
jgi:prefoldin subunit 5